MSPHTALLRARFLSALGSANDGDASGNGDANHGASESSGALAADGDALGLRGHSCKMEGDEHNTIAERPGGDNCALTSDRVRFYNSPAVCGRPFLVKGTARLAESSPESTWPARLPTLMLPRAESVRKDLVEHYVAMGLMEHASIAAFARFTLQLLAWGAPAELIEESNRAQHDETRHARTCFALASTYAGRAIGPGPLPLDHALDSCSFEAFFETTVLEGCIGETRASLEARWAAERCVDPVVREILHVLSDDETRHAELSWRAARWMIAERPELKRLVPRLFGEVEGSRTSDESRPEGARAWGVLNNTELAACWSDAWAEIITPCARALVRSTSTGTVRPPSPARRSA